MNLPNSPAMRIAARDAKIRELEGNLETANNRVVELEAQLGQANRLGSDDISAFLEKLAGTKSKFAARAKELLGS